MQIKTKMRNHYTEMAKIQKKNLRLCVSGEDVDPQELSFIIGGNATWYSLTVWGRVRQLLIKPT